MDDGDNRERLNALLAANAEICREKTLYRTRREEAEARLMKNPLSTVKAFAYFGLLLGAIVPAAMFLKVFSAENADAGLVVLFIFINLVCAVFGYPAGKIIGKWVAQVETHSWNSMLLALPFIGATWGIMTGAAGGILFFVIGALFGAIVAAAVGAVAVPAFTIFHRLLKKGDSIELKHFLPLAFGIVFIISAFIFGL